MVGVAGIAIMEIWLDIQSREGEKRAPLAGSRVTIGRGEAVDVRLSDAGLSRLHASIHREGDRIWILDEGSANGTSVNDVTVSSRGTLLSDGDVIRLGPDATMVVRFGDRRGVRLAAQSTTASPRLTMVAAVLLGIVFLSGIAVLATRPWQNHTEENKIDYPTPAAPTPSSTEPVKIDLPPPATGSGGSNGTLVGATGAPSNALYLRMTQDEQYAFLDHEAQRVTLLIGNREYVFEKEVLGYIKQYVDVYAKRVGNGSPRLWSEDLNRIFDRARRLAPMIIAAFRREGVPVALGLYIPMIESEYNECLRSPAGALGLYQFIEGTARSYGVSPADRCRVERMAPAAARYMSDNIRLFGSDGMSVALGIAGYNRAPQSVMRDLQDVRDSRNNERSFWTLLAKKEELDRYFQNENVKYVPKFFAATIVGENPEAFGLQIRKLSTYDQP
jgi:FHA domain-containing protein/transglycosylase-like protein with SLT domain